MVPTSRIDLYQAETKRGQLGGLGHPVLLFHRAALPRRSPDTVFANTDLPMPARRLYGSHWCDLLGRGCTGTRVGPNESLGLPMGLTGLERGTRLNAPHPLCHIRPSHINATAGTCVTVSAKSVIPLEDSAESTGGRLADRYPVAERLHKRLLSHRWAVQACASRKVAVTTASRLMLTFCHVPEDLASSTFLPRYGLVARRYKLR